MLKNHKLQTKVIFANWKMHFSQPQAIEFCHQLFEYIDQNPEIGDKLVLIPPTLYIGLIGSMFPSIGLAAQDVSSICQSEGPFTGEISAHMLAGSNVKYVLIGHYERKKYFNENSININNKIQNCINNGIIPIICFGEQNQGDDPIAALLDLQHFEHQKIIYAYEPYWAIGNKDFRAELINANLEKLIYYLKSSTNVNYQNNWLIYGGSVNSQNIIQLNSIKGLDGMLVGGASLKIDEIIKILHSI